MRLGSCQHSASVCVRTLVWTVMQASGRCLKGVCTHWGTMTVMRPAHRQVCEMLVHQGKRHFSTPYVYVLAAGAGASTHKEAEAQSQALKPRSNTRTCSVTMSRGASSSSTATWHALSARLACAKEASASCFPSSRPSAAAAAAAAAAASAEPPGAGSCWSACWLLPLLRGKTVGACVGSMAVAFFQPAVSTSCISRSWCRIQPYVGSRVKPGSGPAQHTTARGHVRPAQRSGAACNTTRSAPQQKHTGMDQGTVTQIPPGKLPIPASKNPGPANKQKPVEPKTLLLHPTCQAAFVAKQGVHQGALPNIGQPQDRQPQRTLLHTAVRLRKAA